MTDEELREKFRDVTQEVLPEEAQARILRQVDTLEAQRDIRSLTESIAAGM
jgi:hypothetical protein